MVERLVTSGAGVEVVIGPAGTGKTYALEAARAGWQQQRVGVIGCALAARAALELQAGAGIPSVTIDRLLLDLGRAETTPATDTVIRVDDAGSVGNRHIDH